MDVTFEFTRDDYWQLNKLVLERQARVRRPGRRPSWKLLGLLSLAFVVLFALYSGLVVATDGWGALGAELAAVGRSWVGWVVGGLMLLIAVLLLVLAVLLVVLKLLLPRVAKQLVSEEGSLLGRHRVAVEEGGVRLETPKASGFYSWSGVLELVDAPAYLVLFVDVASAVMVPKRAFADDAAARSFLEDARRRWEAGRRAAASAASPGSS